MAQHNKRLGPEAILPDLENELLRVIQGSSEICAHSALDGAGTKATGYALPDCGPFKCSNCIHADDEADCCDHPKVIADEDVPKHEGKAKVHPDSCCNYFHPKDGHGKPEKDVSASTWSDGLVTKEFKITAQPDFIARFENLLAQIQYLGSVGHSCVAGIFVDGDGADRVEFEPAVKMNGKVVVSDGYEIVRSK